MDIGHIRNLTWSKANKVQEWIGYNRLRGQYMSGLEHAVPERFFNDPRQGIGTAGAAVRNVARVLAALAGLSCAGALAQHGSFADALKDVQPAGAACRRDDAPPRAQTAATAAAPTPDLSCAVGVADLAALQAAGRAVIVDVRPQAADQARRIDGALAMNPSELRTKGFLRERPVVLAGSGKQQRDLYEACTVLKAHGFRHARVLRGGMAAWAGTVERLSAVELWAEYQFDANLVIVPDSQQALRDLLPLAFPVPQADAAALRKVLARRRAELKDAPLASVVIALPAGAGEAQIEELRRAVLPAPLLVYVDDAPAFVRQMQAQRAVWAAHARGPKPPPCGS
jgi:rhodanese-related sulfurtransferase